VGGPGVARFHQRVARDSANWQPQPRRRATFCHDVTTPSDPQCEPVSPATQALGANCAILARLSVPFAPHPDSPEGTPGRNAS
jgi:hypothetical protein